MVRIPVEYQEVEYLESDGSSYINSEIIPSVSDLYTFRGEFRNIENSVLFGCRSSGTYQNSNHLYLNRNGNGGRGGTGIVLLVANAARAANSDFDKNVFFATGNNLPLEINESDVSIEGRTSSSFAPMQPIYLLGFNVLGQNSESVGGGKLSYFKINGRCEFIPCYRKSDNKPGMYDTVAKQFFTNAGTGEFIVGNDVSWDTASLIERRRQILLNSPHLETISDSMASFKTDVPVPLKSCKINFAPIQEGSGDPSPDNVRPISGWDGWFFAAHGQNFWDDSMYADASWYPRADDNSDYYTGTLQNMSNIHGDGSLLDYDVPIGIVSVCFDRLEQGSTIRLYLHYAGDTAWTNYSGNNTTAGHKTWISPANKVCDRVRIYTIAGASATGSYRNLQITKSDTELPYEPFKGIRKHAVPYELAGKNLFSISGCTKYGYINASNTIVPSMNSQYSDYIPVTSSVGYVLSGRNLADTNRIITIDSYDVQKAYIGRIGTIDVPSMETFELPIVAPSNASYVRVSMPLLMENVQFELGSTATAYEPFTTFYGGYVDLVKGELVVDWIKVELASQSWYMYTYSGNRVFTTDYLSLAPKYVHEGDTHIICDAYRTEPAHFSNRDFGIYGPDLSVSLAAANPSRSYALFKDARASTKAEFAELVKNYSIAYRIATPVTYQLTPETIKTIKGVNNIWSNANGNIEVTFWKH